MKKTILYLLLAVALLGTTTASARKVKVPKMYMFGFAAAFTDTIVHFTPVQELDSVWIESKNNFLQKREAYSYQLRSYLSENEQMPQRTCVVVYAQDRKKLEKKYQKMKKLYTTSKDGLAHYDVRYIEGNKFHFQYVDAGDVVETVEEAEEGKE